LLRPWLGVGVQWQQRVIEILGVLFQIHNLMWLLQRRRRWLCQLCPRLVLTKLLPRRLLWLRLLLRLLQLLRLF